MPARLRAALGYQTRRELKAKSLQMPENKLASVIHQLLLALKALHQAHLIHGSLDASAVFISASGRVRLGNFTYSAHSEGASCRGQLASMAPERLLAVDHSHKSDIWSLGLMMLKILKGEAHPLGDPSLDLLAYKRTVCSIGQDIDLGQPGACGSEGALLPSNGPFSASVRLFVQRCLDRNPNHRPSVSIQCDPGCGFCSPALSLLCILSPSACSTHCTSDTSKATGGLGWALAGDGASLHALRRSGL
jgi:serine/threonine protein kinase